MVQRFCGDIYQIARLDMEFAMEWDSGALEILMLGAGTGNFAVGGEDSRNLEGCWEMNKWFSKTLGRRDTVSS